MRVGTTFNQQLFLQNLNRLGSDLERALRQLSSGRRVQTASDDPAAAAELLRLSEEAQRYGMRRQGLAQARPFLELTETALSQLGGHLITAQEKAVQAANGTLADDEREIMADEIAALRDDVLALADLRHGGRYIFSGTATDTPPYDTPGAYQGNTSLVEIPLDSGTVTLNIPGVEAFGETGVGGPIDVLERLEAALRANDEDAIRNVLPELDQALTDNSRLLGRVGARRTELENADLRMQELQLEVARRTNELGAADMAKVISDVARLETGYQATLQAGARLFGPTFFDFLG